MNSKEMTKAEEQVMQIIWKLEKCMVNDILSHFPKPKPAYTTVSTIVRILEKKGFVSHKVYGNTHEYFPLVSKEKYTSDYFKGFLKGYFSDSFSNLVSFFSRNDEIDLQEMEIIMKMLKNEIKVKKGRDDE
ncbi:MAG: BlaI/MecI/CopY family transcriptional regulator [Ignavibacteriaceae bacterium]